jgi:hypothetical protein
MKLFKQDGMSLKPIAIMLAILGGLIYYMMRDIKKLQTLTPNAKSKTTDQLAENSEKSAKIQALPHEEIINKLSEELKKPGVCASAFQNRAGSAGKFFNSEDLPPTEDIVKVSIGNKVVLEIDQVFGEYKVRDIFFSADINNPIENQGNKLVHKTNLQVMWDPIEDGEPISSNPISLTIVTEIPDQMITDCIKGNLNSVATHSPVMPVTNKAGTGSVCGVINFECRGSFLGEIPNIVPHTAMQVDGVFCEGHRINQAQCVFTDMQRGFRLEGLSCPEGYRPLTHAGHLGDSENGEGATKTTNVLQLLMVMCVKQ